MMKRGSVRSAGRGFKMSEAEYIEVTNRTKLRIAYSVLGEIVGGYGPISSEWLTEMRVKFKEVIEKADKKKLVD